MIAMVLLAEKGCKPSRLQLLNMGSCFVRLGILDIFFISAVYENWKWCSMGAEFAFRRDVKL